MSTVKMKNECVKQWYFCPNYCNYPLLVYDATHKQRVQIAFMWFRLLSLYYNQDVVYRLKICSKTIILVKKLMHRRT